MSVLQHDYEEFDCLHLAVRHNCWFCQQQHSPTIICCGVPQGFVLGPILFILYTQPLSCVIIQYHTSYMLMLPKYTVLVDQCYHPQHGEMHM